MRSAGSYAPSLMVFLPPWRWWPLPPTGAITTALPNPSAKTSSKCLRQHCLCLVWSDSRGGASSIVLTRLIRFLIFYFSAALPLYPFHPACIDSQPVPLLSCFPSPSSLLSWHHRCIALTLPVLVQCHRPPAIALSMLLSYPHRWHCHRRCNMLISLPSLPTYVPRIWHVLSCHPCQHWCQRCNISPWLWWRWCWRHCRMFFCRRRPQRHRCNLKPPPNITSQRRRAAANFERHRHATNIFHFHPCWLLCADIFFLKCQGALDSALWPWI